MRVDLEQVERGMPAKADHQSFGEDYRSFLWVDKVMRALITEVRELRDLMRVSEAARGVAEEEAKSLTARMHKAHLESAKRGQELDSLRKDLTCAREKVDALKAKSATMESNYHRVASRLHREVVALQGEMDGASEAVRDRCEELAAADRELDRVRELYRGALVERDQLREVVKGLETVAASAVLSRGVDCRNCGATGVIRRHVTNTASDSAAENARKAASEAKRREGEAALRRLHAVADLAAEMVTLTATPGRGEAAGSDSATVKMYLGGGATYVWSFARGGKDRPVEDPVGEAEALVKALKAFATEVARRYVKLAGADVEDRGAQTPPNDLKERAVKIQEQLAKLEEAKRASPAATAATAGSSTPLLDAWAAGYRLGRHNAQPEEPRPATAAHADGHKAGYHDGWREAADTLIRGLNVASLVESIRLELNLTSWATTSTDRMVRSWINSEAKRARADHPTAKALSPPVPAPAQDATTPQGSPQGQPAPEPTEGEDPLDAYANGYNDGVEAGYAKGKADWHAEGRKDALRSLGLRIGCLAEALRGVFYGLTDIERAGVEREIHRWLDKEDEASPVPAQPVPAGPVAAPPTPRPALALEVRQLRAGQTELLRALQGLLRGMQQSVSLAACWPAVAEFGGRIGSILQELIRGAGGSDTDSEVARWEAEGGR